VVALIRSALPVLLAGYFWFFGMYASYTQGRLFLSILVPPVAWFDSVYFWFLPASWEKGWDSKVTLACAIIHLSIEEKASIGLKFLEEEQQIVQWIQTLPGERRAMLRAHMEMFARGSAEHAFKLVKAMQSGGKMPDEPLELLRAQELEPGVRFFVRERQRAHAMALDIINKKKNESDGRFEALASLGESDLLDLQRSVQVLLLERVAALFQD
jgi:hypothetical protein